MWPRAPPLLDFLFHDERMWRAELAHRYSSLPTQHQPLVNAQIKEIHEWRCNLSLSLSFALSVVRIPLNPPVLRVRQRGGLNHAALVAERRRHFCFVQEGINTTMHRSSPGFVSFSNINLFCCFFFFFVSTVTWSRLPPSPSFSPLNRHFCCIPRGW